LHGLLHARLLSTSPTAFTLGLLIAGHNVHLPKENGAQKSPLKARTHGGNSRTDKKMDAGRYQEVEDVGFCDGRSDVIALKSAPLVLFRMYPGTQREL
jgi:hypothetical protein